MDASALAKSIAALRSSIRALEGFSDSLEPWLYFWVTLVVFGVVFEVGFVLWEHREGIREHRRGTISSPQKPSGWRLLFELFGAVLVALGVAGELGVDIKSGRIQTSLRARSGELTELLQVASSAAMERASKADEQAANAIESASKNEKEAAQLRKDAQVAEKTAAEARLELAELKATRVLKADAAMRQQLQEFKGTPFDLAVAQDVDSNRLAGAVFNLLTSQGWVRIATGHGTVRLWATPNIFVTSSSSDAGVVYYGGTGQARQCEVLGKLFTESEIYNVGMYQGGPAIPYERQLPLVIIIGEKPKASIKELMRPFLREKARREKATKKDSQ
jgi:hypothetical protein